MKILLNAHSTALMTRLGLVVGNTMTSVRPGNLKLIGRATNLIRVHVNDALRHMGKDEITYNDANAVLFEAIYYRSKQEVKTLRAEVPLSIVKIL